MIRKQNKYLGFWVFFCGRVFVLEKDKQTKKTKQETTHLTACGIVDKKQKKKRFGFSSLFFFLAKTQVEKNKLLSERKKSHTKKSHWAIF